jgi:tetratricopeptide (TPR) repeat protein
LAVAGTVGWTAHARSAERAEAGRRAEEFLGDADRLEQAGHWAEALALVERAEAVLGGTGDAGLNDRVRQRKRVLGLVLRTEAIRIEVTADRDYDFNFELGDRFYAEAFREYGLDIDALSPAAVAERLPGGAARGEVVATLDDWARVRRLVREEGDRGWEHLLAAARAADPDSWRDRVRATWQQTRPYDRDKPYVAWEMKRERILAAGRDRGPAGATLKELLETAPLDQLQPGMVIYLAEIAGHHPTVLAMLREVQRRRPGDFWLNHTLATQLELTRPAEAVPFFRAALALRPDTPSVVANLGWALSNSDQFDEAIAIYKRALQLKLNFIRAQHNLGVTLARKGDLGEAVAAFRQAIRLQPGNWVALYNLGTALCEQGRVGEAVDTLRESIRLRPSNARAYNNLGIALDKSGAVDEAIAAYREAIRLGPNLAAGHCSLGKALFERKRDYDGAVAAFRRVIELQPNLHSHYINLGSALTHQGALDPAIAAYREAIRLKPDDVLAHKALAGVLGLKGAWGEAVVVIRELVRLQPDNAEFRFALSDALDAKGDLDAKRGDLDEATAAYREAVRLKPLDVPARRGLVHVFTRKGAWDEVLVVSRELVRLEPATAEFQATLGRALAAKGKLDEAIGAIREAIRLQPDEFTWRLYLSYSFLLKRAWDDLAATARDAIRLKPDSAEAHCNLGHALRGQGHYQEALAAFRRGHELGSRIPGWRYPSARWVKECEALAAAAEKHRTPGPKEVAPLRPPRK